MALIVDFATTIYHAPALSSKSRLHQELRAEAHLIREKDKDGQMWSKENYLRGYTSYGSLDRVHQLSSTFDELRKILDSHVHRYVSRLKFDIHPRELQMTRMWINIMGQACTHSFHIHPLSVISGTHYVQMPPRGSAIKFEDPRLNQMMARPPVRSSSKSSNPYLSLKPKSGDVVLFESWLKHEVPPHQDRTERISVSFNYDWVGKDEVSRVSDLRGSRQ
ncbi:MAG: hypothetical protein C5B49_10190 [Bdellovibrio sp.]|nr:MAG: hypothetical protein C5B49_10190 [Bdellovibrio sp.]